MLTFNIYLAKKPIFLCVTLPLYVSRCVSAVHLQVGDFTCFIFKYIFSIHKYNCKHTT